MSQKNMFNSRDKTHIRTHIHSNTHTGQFLLYIVRNKKAIEL